MALGCLAGRADPVAMSGPGRVSLVELYTSEGCSSCPPAERWLGSLRDEPGLWRQFVPVSFHVTYWDSLGWTDRFASPDYTRRQYAYAGRWGARSVYTPCFVRDGAEWRPSRAPEPRAGDAPGTLSVDREAPGRYRIRFAPSSALPGSYRVSAVLLGGGVRSKVGAGENEGSTLEHEFVVLRLQTAELRAEEGKGYSGLVAWDESVGLRAPRLAIAAWISVPGSEEPLQAAGGWLRP